LATGGCALGHLGRERVGTLAYFFLGNVLDVLRQAPDVAEGIAQLAVAVAPERRADFLNTARGMGKSRRNCLEANKNSVPAGDRSASE